MLVWLVVHIALRQSMSHMVCRASRMELNAALRKLRTAKKGHSAPLLLLPRRGKADARR